MNTAKILPFQFKNTEVRTIKIDDLIWFVASDVAKALEYPQAKDLARILDDDEKGRQIVPTPSGDIEMVIINESGLYHAILKSRKPEAVPFRKWVTGEVLPAIRKTGSYSATITLAQQGELATLIAERFPDGKNRPYAWSRFNNHFRIGSYKNLPVAKFAEACDYITSLPVKQEVLPPPSLLGRRWLVSYDHNGKEQVTPVPEDAAVMSIEQLLKAISTPGAMAIKTETLADFSVAVTRQLQERLQYHERKLHTTQQRLALGGGA